MGDSLSAAYGMNQEQGWVSLLAQKPTMQPIQVINASLSGETTSGGKQRLKALIAKHQPRWLILELGANDALRGQNLKHSQQNLQEMINACQAPKCHSLLLGIRLPTNYGPAYDLALQRMYQQLAEHNTLLFDPFFLEDIVLDSKLMQADALHPNAAAQPLILQRMWPNIQKLLLMPDIKTP